MSDHKRIELITRKRGYPFRGMYFGEKTALEATFKDDDNNLVDPDTPPTVRIKDPTGKIIVSDGKAIQRSKGKWYYEYIMPDNIEIGLWVDIWTATIHGKDYEESRKIWVRDRPEPTGQAIRYGVFRIK